MSYCSDEEDMSDAEVYETLNRTILRKPRTIKRRTNFFNSFQDNEFFKRFRMCKASAYQILDIIGPHIKKPTSWNDSITEEQMFLITLRVYATGGMLRTIGDTCGVSTTAVSKSVSIVTHNIAQLGKHFIKFPTTKEELDIAKKEFYRFAKFPRVAAALDCTHVRIISPGGNDAELYRNRKGFFSINVQTMCDANLKIINLVARWPGSAHDSTILLNSRIYSRFESGDFGDSVIVADSGYPSKPFIMTPLSNATSLEENLYNESQIRTRNSVERSYGVWKRRFPILSLGIRLNISKVEAIIVATAVLHNICCINNENQILDLPEGCEDAITYVATASTNVSNSNVYANTIARRNLIDNYFKKLL